MSQSRHPTRTQRSSEGYERLHCAVRYVGFNAGAIIGLKTVVKLDWEISPVNINIHTNKNDGTE